MLELSVFLGGKLVSYFASAYLHVSECTCLDAEVHRRALSVDKAAVSVAIASSGVPFARGAALQYMLFHLTCVVWSAVAEARRRDNTRVMVCTAQFLYTVVIIGDSVCWNLLWVAGTLFYLAAFLCFFYVHGREPGTPAFSTAVPWHSHDSYGMHEEFHNFLLVADMCFLVLIVVRC
jgi:predicted membrane channel-forming protein YqfA (hemolysin III family)